MQTVQTLVEAGVSANNRYPVYPPPALLGAACGGSYEKVKFLLDQGADVDAIGPINDIGHRPDGLDGNALLAAVLSRSKSVLELLLR